MSETKKNPHTWWMYVVVTLSGIGFAYKFLKFSDTWFQGELLGFALVPLLIYIMVSAGFACLLFWAVLGGQFRNLEAPKEDLMQVEFGGDDPIPVPRDQLHLDAGGIWASRFAVGSMTVVLGYLLLLQFSTPVQALGPRIVS